MFWFGLIACGLVEEMGGFYFLLIGCGTNEKASQRDESVVDQTNLSRPRSRDIYLHRSLSKPEAPSKFRVSLAMTSSRSSSVCVVPILPLSFSALLERVRADPQPTV